MTTSTEFQFTDYDPYDFANRRHIGPSPAEMQEMLKIVGYPTLDALIDATVPSSIRQQVPLTWGKAMTEREALDKLRETANKNQALTSLIGQGYYGTITPPVIQRNILENPAWYTAYTPYQPEISQGRLEALLNFQTMVCDLTGLDVANASLLDEATAAAEAMALCQRSAKTKATAFFVDENCHPQTIAVIQTRAEPLGWTVIVGNPFTDLDPVDVFGAIFQYPGTNGQVSDFSGLINLSNRTQFYYLCLVCLFAVIALIWRIGNSRFGLVVQGLRSNEQRMQAIGFPARRYQLVCFVISGTMCGLAGALLANNTDFVSPAVMYWTRSGDLMVMVILGGMGTLFGPVMGAVVFLLLEEVLSQITEYWALIMGPLLLLIVLFGRGGIMGLLGRMRRV